MGARSGAQTRAPDALPVRAVLAVFGKIEPVQIVEWIVEDKLDVRFQLQMHKFIWEPATKGV